MMLHPLKKRYFSKKDLHTQKCLVPPPFMITSNFKPGDVVSIDCDDRHFVCRIFPQSTTEIENCILIDNTVSYISDKHKSEYLQNVNPSQLSVVKPTAFDKVCVQIIIDDENDVFVENQTYCRIVSVLLRNYVIRKNATLKCKGRCLADLFHIHSIIITETFNDNVFGRLSRTGTVEIVQVLSRERLNQLQKFGGTYVGGINESAKTLKTYLTMKASKRILISGPSGCGKSLFVNKFFSGFKCCLVSINGLRDSNLTVNKCDMYCKQLLQSSEMFPNLLSVLLVDHADELASSSAKLQNKKSMAALLYLVKSIENSKVAIIIVAAERKLIHPVISILFEDEVFLGIPSFHQRKEMLAALIQPILNNLVDYDSIAALTPGFLACDIAQLVENATSGLKGKYQMQVNSENIVLDTQHFEKALHSITPSLLKTSKWNMKVKPVYWKDIGGMNGIKKRLQLCIERPLRHPEIFQKVGLRCPRGVLLFGPPGCCKTTLARGLATECNATFFVANPSQIYSSYVGESEKSISQLFYQARLCSPSIIFLDELDSLVGCRTFDAKQQGVSEKILSTLLNEMDGLGVKTNFRKNNYMNPPEENERRQLQNEVIVVGATNRPDTIDDALLRPGRFDIIMYVPPPNLQERVSILETITRNMPLNDVDLQKIAEHTDSFTGADLKHVCSVAAMNALKENLANSETVSEHNFMQALEKAQPSVNKMQIQMYEDLLNKYGPVIF